MKHISQRIDPKHIETIRQFTRYALVGVANTLLTLVVIFVCKGLFHVNPWLSNGIGYVAGFINSFILNKTWVFRSDRNAAIEAMKFCLGFLLCYGLQLAATWLLTEHTAIGDFTWTLPGFTISGYALATLIGMAFYTIANYVFNRVVTFR